MGIIFPLHLNQTMDFSPFFLRDYLLHYFECNYVVEIAIKLFHLAKKQCTGSIKISLLQTLDN